MTVGAMQTFRNRAPWLTIILVSGIIAFLATQRDFFTFATETDYLGGFIHEAQRILQGLPLHLEFHPPFYAAAISVVYLLARDWFTTGLVVSWLSAVVVLISTFLLFRRLLSSGAAWGAILALLVSPVFLSFSAFATSDVFNLALYSMSLLFAFYAFERESAILWITTGSVIACAVLTRTNSITLLLLLFIPWLSSPSIQMRARFFAYVVGGFICIITIWAGYAVYTGSPLSPRNTYLNLALTYFAPDQDRLSWDARKLLVPEFTNLWQVISLDPVHILKQYTIDLYRLVLRVFQSNVLLAFPANFLVLPAMAYLLLNMKSRMFLIKNRLFLILLTVTTAQFFLINFKAFEARYFLFLVPVFGALVGEAFAQLRLSTTSGLLRIFSSSASVYLILIFLAVPAASKSIIIAHGMLHNADDELSESVQKVQQVVPDNSIIISRKPHIPYYAQADFIVIPSGSSLDDLKQFMEAHAGPDPLFVYWGSIERKRRKEFYELNDPDKVSQWLDVAATSDSPDKWVLYRYSGND